MTKIVVSKLAREIHDGDWHDAPLRWQVAGPGAEIQNFSTKKDALLYAKLRRKAKSFQEASDMYRVA
ncbi:hypothetical protein PHIN3_376 [Sinorhizobium phage phiN3]|uniref:Uncharacterized protein n=1 Tax=Sinorhizobium phage phiN3 TaxID=1647405 RepID=A0A0F6WD04_9CAUD|nr:hypothetical protein AVT40_gp157 [Sinorhizobium phage phiN3]AKF13639.1 hypothetical protein PHIN3_376 [Sinorhizobium phage phiN3]